MLAALKDLPPEVKWTYPKGGLFLWVTLPKGMNCQKLFEDAVRENVAFVPGDCFYAGNGYTEEGFSCTSASISLTYYRANREGVRRLAIAVKHQMQVLAPVHACSTIDR